MIRPHAPFRKGRRLVPPGDFEQLEGGPRIEAAREDGEHCSGAGRRRRDYALKTERVSGFPDRLAIRGVVPPQQRIRETDGGACLRGGQIEDRLQMDMEPAEVARNEVADVEPLASCQAVELFDDGLDLGSEVESRVAPRRIPAPTVNTRSRSGAWVDAWADVAKRDGIDRGGTERTDLVEELGRGHGLNEDTLCECVDRAENASKIALPKELDRLVMVEQRIGREQPVVRSLRP